MANLTTVTEEIAVLLNLEDVAMGPSRPAYDAGKEPITMNTYSLSGMAFPLLQAALRD